jgi:hypothetical protein
MKNVAKPDLKISDRQRTLSRTSAVQAIILDKGSHFLDQRNKLNSCRAIETRRDTAYIVFYLSYIHVK